MIEQFLRPLFLALCNAHHPSVCTLNQRQRLCGTPCCVQRACLLVGMSSPLCVRVDLPRVTARAASSHGSICIPLLVSAFICRRICGPMADVPMHPCAGRTEQALDGLLGHAPEPLPAFFTTMDACHVRAVSHVAHEAVTEYPWHDFGTYIRIVASVASMLSACAGGKCI